MAKWHCENGEMIVIITSRENCKRSWKEHNFLLKKFVKFIQKPIFLINTWNFFSLFIVPQKRNHIIWLSWYKFCFFSIPSLIERILKKLFLDNSYLLSFLFSTICSRFKCFAYKGLPVDLEKKYRIRRAISSLFKKRVHVEIIYERTFLTNYKESIKYNFKIAFSIICRKIHKTRKVAFEPTLRSVVTVWLHHPKIS